MPALDIRALHISPGGHMHAHWGESFTYELWPEGAGEEALAAAKAEGPLTPTPYTPARPPARRRRIKTDTELAAARAKKTDPSSE